VVINNKKPNTKYYLFYVVKFQSLPFYFKQLFKLFTSLVLLQTNNRQEMRIVDVKGQQCPAPIIATKKALKESEKGEAFKVLTDNQTSLNNLTRFLMDNKTEFSVDEADGVWTLIITKNVSATSIAEVENYCTPAASVFPKGDFVIAITSDRMGDGSDELGHLLIGNFIKTIKDLDLLPRKIIFYNKGVTLVSDESPFLRHIKDLEKMGVELLICATCVDYYSLDGKIEAGILSNMFVIADALASAGNVVRP